MYSPVPVGSVAVITSNDVSIVVGEVKELSAAHISRYNIGGLEMPTMKFEMTLMTEMN